MKTSQQILLDYVGGKSPVTEFDKKFYRISVDDCLKVMDIAVDLALENEIKRARELCRKLYFSPNNQVDFNKEEEIYEWVDKNYLK